MGKRKPRIAYVGVDVSKDSLEVAWYGLDGSLETFAVGNDEAGHQEIATRTTAGRIGETRIVVEATGPYHQRLVAHLMSAKKVRVMVAQPAATAAFGTARRRRAKTDRVDAAMLAEFARTMEFIPHVAPEKKVAEARRVARHMGNLIEERAGLMNERHAAQHGDDASPFLLKMLDKREAVLTELINECEAELERLLLSESDTAAVYERVTAVQGIKRRLATRLLPELLAMPTHLTPRQAVAHAGLDPRPRQSGTSRTGTSWRISKQGNPRIRQALYMATLTAIRWFPPLRAHYERLRASGKLKKVALVACMRKLLTALWVMVAKNQAFDLVKFAGPRLAA